MLAELVRYAAAKGLDTEAGFRPKDVKWLLLFKDDGTFIGVAPYGVEKRGRRVEKCPHIQFSGDTPMRQFLVDTAEYYAQLGGEPGDAKLQRKHAYAIDLLAKAGVAVPELAAIAGSMAKGATIDAIRSALSSVKAKPADNATPALVLRGGDRRIFVEESGWHDWWRSFRLTLFGDKEHGDRAGDKAGSRSLCLVTGQLCDPALIHPKVRRLGDVGAKAEPALVSFNRDAFRSYGLKKSANAAVSPNAANAYVSALNHLIERTGQRLGSVKVVHWYAGRRDAAAELPPEEDPLRFVESLEGLFGAPSPPGAPATGAKRARKRDRGAESRATEQHAQARARAFLRSVTSGERADLIGYHYHALTLSGSSARVMVRDYATGPFVDLCEAIGAWFDDLDIVARHGDGLAPSPKFAAVLAAMARELDDVPPPVAAKLWRCAVLQEAIPDSLAAQALSRATIGFVTGEPANHARMGLLRAHLYRKGDHEMRPHVNEEHREDAYHCGRLLAVLDDIQYAALGDVGAGIVQRYYAAASVTPALVLGRLIRLANTGHLPKLDYDRRQRLEQRLARVWACMGKDPPTTLTLTQQTLFAMGYYQEKANH